VWVPSVTEISSIDEIVPEKFSVRIIGLSERETAIRWQQPGAAKVVTTRRAFNSLTISGC
jgi:hypothetical protein